MDITNIHEYLTWGRDKSQCYTLSNQHLFCTPNNILYTLQTHGNFDKKYIRLQDQMANH